ncbi:MAG: hypothetical protein E2590_01735 [Chryseobacterium sp.]|nr:hypothetical protein [Chryseobacterium sp.]
MKKQLEFVKPILFCFLISLLIVASCKSNDIEELVTITVVRNSEDYNSIRNTIASIKDASESKQYVVFVPNGIYRETDIQGKKFVKIIGENKDETILICDPLGSMANLTSPSDYYFTEQANKRLSEIPHYQRHLFNLSDDIYAENITIYAKDCKYSIHLDDSRYRNVYFKNCWIKGESCNQVIGVGLHYGQDIRFDRCTIEGGVDLNTGIFVHNWYNQLAGNRIDLNDCDFENCTYMIIDELGSNQKDYINLLNCKTNVEKSLELMVDQDGDGRTFWTNPVTGIKEADPTKVPYSFYINVKGTQIDKIFSRDSGNFSPIWTGVPQRDIDTFKKNMTGF